MRKRKLKMQLKKLRDEVDHQLETHGKAILQLREQVHALAEQVREIDKQIDSVCS